jgi:hypothetical protein
MLFYRSKHDESSILPTSRVSNTWLLWLDRLREAWHNATISDTGLRTRASMEV